MVSSWPLLLALDPRSPGRTTPAGPPEALRALEQAALLAAAAHAARASAADALRPWQAAPFVDAVLRQTRSRFLLRAAARLLRCAPRRGGASNNSESSDRL